MRAKELELLSPAGNIEIFKSAIDAGADAVYFGGDLFGAWYFRAVWMASSPAVFWRSDGFSEKRRRFCIRRASRMTLTI